MADVGRITELWRKAAAAIDVPRNPSADDAHIALLAERVSAAWDEISRLEAECGRLREQLDAARQALQQIAHGEPPDDVWDLNVASSGVEWAGKIARAALGVEGEQARKCVFCGRGGPTVKPRGAQRVLACNRAACQHQAEQK